MTIKTETRIINPTLRLWEEDYGRYGCDCLPDLWDTICLDYKHDDEGNWLMTDAQFNENITWWEDEVRNANENPDYEGEVLKGVKPGDMWNLDY